MVSSEKARGDGNAAGGAGGGGPALGAIGRYSRRGSRTW
jgi:hypothetical protein